MPEHLQFLPQRCPLPTEIKTLINSIFVSLNVEQLENLSKGIFFSYTFQSQQQKSDEGRSHPTALAPTTDRSVFAAFDSGEFTSSTVSMVLGSFWLHFHKRLISLYQQMLLLEPHDGFLLLPFFVCVKLEKMKENSLR